MNYGQNQPSYCSLGGAEFGQPFEMLPLSGVQVGPNVTLSTIPTLRQLQPGFQQQFPSCQCLRQNGRPGPKISLGGCAAHGSGGGGDGAGACNSAPDPAAIAKRESMAMPMFLNGASTLSAMHSQQPAHVQAKGPAKGQQQPTNGSGASCRPDDVNIVVVGKDWCGWSKKFQAVLAKRPHPKFKYVTEVPSGYPPAGGFPTMYAVCNTSSHSKLLKSGYVDVSDPKIAADLVGAAQLLFA